VVGITIFLEKLIPLRLRRWPAPPPPPRPPPVGGEAILYKSFNSYTDAAKIFDCSPRTLSRHLDKNKLYKKKWILSSSEK